MNNKNFNKNEITKLKNIEVIGLEEKDNNQLIDDLSLFKLNDIFFLNSKDIKKVINSNEYIENYSVFKKYPSTINVEVDMTEFLAQFKKNGINHLLGSNGKFIKSNILDKDIPFIFGEFDEESFFELKSAIDKTNFDYKSIKNLFFFKSGRWDIETKYGLIIKLPKDELKTSLQTFLSFVDVKDLSETKEIDLRQHNQIIING